METFAHGTVISMKNGNAIVEECLNDCGKQFYRVNYCGTEKLLVWSQSHYDDSISYQHIQKCVEIGNIDEGFLWPEDITDLCDEKFGYIVSCIHDDYVPYTEILYNRCNLDYRVIVSAAVRLAKAVESLSKCGLVMYGFTSFNINIKNGRVLIPVDATAVVPAGSKLAWFDAPNYTAPEVSLGAPMDIYSNRFILASFVFKMLFLAHPFGGKKSFAPMTTAFQLRLYAEEPVFIFDKNDDSNRPDLATQGITIRLWERVPLFVKEIFWRSFNKKAVKNPCHRPTEKEFSIVLNELLCVLGNEDDGVIL